MSVELQDHIKGLTAQLEAAKQMVNEGLQISLQLRTNLNLLNQVYQESIQEKTKLDQNVKDLTAKLLELSPASLD